MATKRPKRRQSPAQIASQLTNRLKGDLKNLQLSRLRLAIGLARVRDEKLWKLLKQPDLETWAEEKLGLGRAMLYRYLQVHDWVKANHPAWLAPRPDGFIPDLGDVAILRSIERKLEGRLTAEKRALYEALRERALAGKLSRSEYERATRAGRKPPTKLRQLALGLRALHRRAARMPELPAELVSALGDVAERFDAITRGGAALARLSRSIRAELAALGLRNYSSLRV